MLELSVRCIIVQQRDEAYQDYKIDKKGNTTRHERRSKHDHKSFSIFRKNAKEALDDAPGTCSSTAVMDQPLNGQASYHWLFKTEAGQHLGTRSSCDLTSAVYAKKFSGPTIRFPYDIACDSA